jgi:hypothetical protein
MEKWSLCIDNEQKIYNLLNALNNNANHSHNHGGSMKIAYAALAAMAASFVGTTSASTHWNEVSPTALQGGREIAGRAAIEAAQLGALYDPINFGEYKRVEESSVIQMASTKSG